MQNGKEVVIVYGSKTLSRSQMGYYTTYRELLAGHDLCKTISTLFMRKAIPIKNRPLFFGLAEEL
jgi:hypothetical protein